MQFCPKHTKREVLPGRKWCQLCANNYARHFARCQQEGRCSCGGVRVNGYKQCHQCRDTERVRREMRKICGLCLCGKNAELGAKSCAVCLQKAEFRRKNKKKFGLCQCGRKPVSGSKVCAFCKNLGVVVRNKNKTNGLCPCGKPPTIGFLSCASCRRLGRLRYSRRIQEDENFVVLAKLRGTIWYGIIRSKGAKKAHSAEKILGCTIAFARKHIEKFFAPGMTWQNRKLWHIDHYLPCNAFDLTDERQQRLCNNWRNLRPMWKKDNLVKGNKLPEDFEKCLAELEMVVPYE